MKKNIVVYYSKKGSNRFGYALVFDKARELIGDKMGICRAFPIEMLIPEEKRSDDKAMMSTRLSSSTFQGAVVERFNKVIDEINN